MLSRVWRWFPGWVQAEAEGGYPEKLLNRMAAAGITVWGIRHGPEQVSFSCYARDYRRLRRPARSACVRMRVRHKHGLPFHLYRYRRRWGLVVGALLYAVLLGVLSTRVWVVQVVGNTETPAAEIAAVAEELGVRVGTRVAALDIKSVEITGLSRLPTLSWITVNPNGCVARVEVAERRPTPQILDLSEPSDIVALRDGRIVSMTVLSGQRVALVGEAVRAGTLLITGRTERKTEDEHTEIRLCRAYGEVMAQTERQLTVSVPLAYEEPIPAGEPILRPTFTFLCWRFPLYAAGRLPENCRIWQREHFLTGGGLTLPLGVTNAYYQPMTVRKRARTLRQAEELAQRLLEAQQKSLFSGIEVHETDRRMTRREGTLILTATYDCVENIASEVPLLSEAALKH